MGSHTREIMGQGLIVLETDMLAYHDALGYEALREPFDGAAIVHDEHDEDGEIPSRPVFQ